MEEFNKKIINFTLYIFMYITFKYFSSFLRDGFLSFNSQKKIDFGDISIRESLINLTIFTYLMAAIYRILKVEQILDSIFFPDGRK